VDHVCRITDLNPLLFGAAFGCSAGVPQVHYFGQEGLHNVLVIDLLGPNMEDLFDMCGRKFTIKTVCMAAKQMVSVTPSFPSTMFACENPYLQKRLMSFLFRQVTRVQSIHDKSLIYRDIKPDNFLIGVPATKSSNTIHVIGESRGRLSSSPRLLRKPVGLLRFWHGETLSGPENKSTYTLPRAEISIWYCTLHVHQYTLGTRAVSAR